MIERLILVTRIDHEAHTETWQTEHARERKLEELELDHEEYVPLWIGDVEERIIPGIDGPPYPYETRCKNRVLTEAEYAAECRTRRTIEAPRGRRINAFDIYVPDSADEDFGKVIDGE